MEMKNGSQNPFSTSRIMGETVVISKLLLTTSFAHGADGRPQSLPRLRVGGSGACCRTTPPGTGKPAFQLASLSQTPKTIQARPQWPCWSENSRHGILQYEHHNLEPSFHTRRKTNQTLNIRSYGYTHTKSWRSVYSCKVGMYVPAHLCKDANTDGDANWNDTHVTSDFNKYHVRYQMSTCCLSQRLHKSAA